MDWKTDPTRETPPSKQIVQCALDAIARGELVSGEALPSVRKMAAAALVNHNTAARAFRDLEAQGVVRGENGRGVFVTEEGPQIAREHRWDETWTALERALAEALRAGHDIEALRKLLGAKQRKSA